MKATRILEQAKGLAAHAKSWADFSNELYSPGGIVAAGFPDEVERQAFFESAQCQEIDKLLASLMAKFGVVDGAGPTERGGRLVVSLPPMEVNSPQHR